MSPSPHMANLKTIQWGVGQDITYPFCRWKNGDAKKLGDKAMVFSLVTYGCESWTIKKAECQRIDAFELWYWKRLESLLDIKEIKPVNLKGNQPWLFFGRTDTEAEAPILWSPDANSQLIGRPWWWERLKAKGEEGSRGWDSCMASLIQWTWTWVNSRRWWGAGRPGMLRSMGSKRVGHNLATDNDNVERSGEAKKVTPPSGSWSSPVSIHTLYVF